MTSIVIADDHPMISSGIELLLRGSCYRLVGRARSGTEALAQVARLAPDLLLLDVHMSDGNGIDALRALRKNGAGTRVILLTAGMDDQTLLEAEALAPDGIVLKTGDPASIFDCLDQVSRGERWLDPEIAARLTAFSADAAEAAEAAEAPVLAPRELQLLVYIRRGLKNRDIADILGITEGTVKVYLHAIFRKLGVSNRTELAMRATELVPTGENDDEAAAASHDGTKKLDYPNT